MKLEFTNQKQFLARIRKLAKERRITPQIMLQEIILDDLIDRISNSPYQNNLVLKGGFLLASLIGTDTRSTRDIDTSIVGLPVTEDKMKSVFREICDIELPDDIIKLSIVKIDEIREDLGKMMSILVTGFISVHKSILHELMLRLIYQLEM
ncbi:nucleotidyl transferase AbiEii/AbiGii toxin family protein [Lactiplantibacillus plantarum]|uniref:nucleotidyl transferase AbiEii/AbiGii toxin family protein n=1 Tax=Lactiplantibacillus plantarum TaxID=1590 RepID=UPI002DDAF531|nr:nucleotidyl transferase AbiEii/AbiGii toxin family protein [Lactiplantibacillus plantarum]